LNAVNFLIGLLPLLVLVGLLVLNRYPGEGMIEKLRELIDHGRPIDRRITPVRGQLSDFLKPVRGGQLIANSMAGRAPPAST